VASLSGLLVGKDARAQATDVFCISSASHLHSQLPVINNVARRGNALDLRFQSGYYDLGNVGGSTAIQIERNALSSVALRAHRISGGWNPGCTLQSTLQNADTSTVLDARGQKSILTFMQVLGPWSSMDWRVSLRIDQLHLADSSQACLQVSAQLAQPGSLGSVPLDVVIERSRFELCGTPQALVTPVMVSVEGNVTVRNNVFTHNIGPTAALGVTAATGIAAIYNNTLRHNQTVGGASSMATLSATTIYFQNNLIADGVYTGAQRDLFLMTGSAFVRNNRLGGTVFQSVPTDVLITSGNTADAPGFINTQSPRLAVNSPMRDRGLAVVPAPGYGPLDWEGHPRSQGAAPEIGAFELAPTAEQEIVLSNGFESP
jgi:hypothetical protein